MPSIGAEVEALRLFARDMDRRAIEMKKTMDRITQDIENAAWHGQDRERFVREWHSSHMPSLGQMLADLSEASKRALQHALQQENASKA